jgi:hypothetical protein
LETYTLNAPVVGTNGEPDGTGASSANLGSGAFAIGVDLEVFAGSDKDAMFQGINTNNDDIFAVISHSGAAGSIASCRYDTYALFDRVIVCENGAGYVRF